MHHLAVSVIGVSMAFASVSSAQTPSGRKAGGVGQEREDTALQLHQLFDERYHWQLEQYPEMAMSQGDYSHADRLTDTSLAAIQNRYDATIEYLHRLSSIDREALSENDLVNYELFSLELQ